jgi:hypothetical protein
MFAGELTIGLPRSSNSSPPFDQKNGRIFL